MKKRGHNPKLTAMRLEARNKLRASIKAQKAALKALCKVAK